MMELYISVALFFVFVYANTGVLLYYFGYGFKKGKALKVQYYLNPLKRTEESDKKYNYLLTSYDAGLCTVSLTKKNNVLFTFTDTDLGEIELYIIVPYYGAFGIKKYMNSIEQCHTKPSFEIYQRLVQIHKTLTSQTKGVTIQEEIVLE